HDTDPDRTPHINHDVSDTLAPLHHHLHHTTHNTKNPAPKNSEQGSTNTKMVDLLATYYNTKPQVDKAIAAINLPADLIKDSTEPTWTRAPTTFNQLHPPPPMRKRQQPNRPDQPRTRYERAPRLAGPREETNTGYTPLPLSGYRH